ncbi:unnamed protein product [Mytilus coruscus]|uniref:Reverse transcriptase domain-containing protein n=1 Tax=Mytilus coruscus TaxID=42192 RepID=A0A6J7ZZ92_MYTCO|nr:unnamed protein product [Mytilus coruscus]
MGDRGVVIYIHKSLTAFKVDILSESGFNESLWCEVKLEGTDKLLLRCIYRSPSSVPSNNKKLNDLICQACNLKYSHYLIMGDFNFPEIKWVDNEVSSGINTDPFKFYEYDLKDYDTNSESNNFLDDINICQEDVLKKLNKLKTEKSAGPDGLHPKVLYEVRPAICYSLFKIFDKSVKEGKVPDDWKNAIVSPIFKKGKKLSPVNYRPVSLTSVVCKICESIIRDNIMKYILMNNLFTSSQYGFRPGSSCVTQLLEVLDEWSELIDNGFPLDSIYLDFSKAFDTVPHQRLFLKLEKLGIKENLDSLCEWSNTWKLKFNAAKCKVLHINPDNDQQYRYTMLNDTENYIALSKVNKENDLGVTFESNLKFEEHISNIVNKAQRV